METKAWLKKELGVDLDDKSNTIQVTADVVRRVLTELASQKKQELLEASGDPTGVNQVAMIEDMELDWSAVLKTLDEADANTVMMMEEEAGPSGEWQPRDRDREPDRHDALESLWDSDKENQQS